MVRGGFFTRQEASEVTKAKRAPRAQVSRETLRKLGPAGVRLMNPKAKNPEMPPDGDLEPLVYVLGEAPGQVEDDEGVPFVGPSGRMLRYQGIPAWGRDSTLFDNCVRTRPPDNRDPKREEIECFRGVVQKSIEKARPPLVLGVGRFALQWATGMKNIKEAAGKMFPVRIGKHDCWFMPVHHPAFLGRIKDGREDKVPGEEWIDVWKKSIREAYDFAEDCETPEFVSDEQALAGIVECSTVKQVEKALEHLRGFDAVGWDVETHNLRPYGEDSLVLSLAISDGERTYAIGIDHDEARWSSKERQRILELLRQFFVDGPKKVAHSLPFDLEWAIHLLGEEIVEGDYGCSLQASYALDPGPPGKKGPAGHSLDFLCVRLFGVPLKALTFAASWKSRLREMTLPKLLQYNGVDARWCLRVWRVLTKEIDKQGLEESYERQMERVVPVVLAQRLGVPVDPRETKKFQQQFGQEIRVLESEIQGLKEVRKFKRLLGRPFKSSSNPDIGRLLGDILGREEVKTAGGYTTKASILESIDEPVVEKLLRMRSLSKLKSTYVDRFMPDHPNTYVYPDGRIHCVFGIAGTRTYRFISESPNNQNWPTRKYKEIRRQLVAPDGWVFVAVDQGQIEARVLAMESKDRVWVQMIYDDYDVHQEWAEKIAEIDDDFARLLDEEPKYARHRAKNEWVFPAFYGSSPRSIIRSLDLVEGLAEELFREFWVTFAGIKRWQRAKWALYKRHRCVWSLTGRRRLAPLSYNMVINTGIQAAASDICVDAMKRLCWRARKEGLSFLQPVLQIHDDLTFLMPESELEYGVSVVVEEQLGFEAPWVNVPLKVEVEVGENLLEMETIGEWRSDAA